MPTRYELLQNDVSLGTLRLVGMDQPWFECEFTPTPLFEQAKPLFDAEYELLEGSDDFNIDAWEAAYAKIDALHLKLVPTNGEASIVDFVLHIDGNEARFRY